jgi:hypothetical protein
MTINRKAASFFIVSKGESLQTMRIWTKSLLFLVTMVSLTLASCLGLKQ